jgi:hypothetical protein
VTVTDVGPLDAVSAILQLLADGRGTGKYVASVTAVLEGMS